MQVFFLNIYVLRAKIGRIICTAIFKKMRHLAAQKRRCRTAVAV